MKSMVKFIYSEKATKFCEITTIDMTVTVQDKSMVEISQNFVAFSEYMNFNMGCRVFKEGHKLFIPSTYSDYLKCGIHN